MMSGEMILANIISDIKNGSSHSVDFLLKEGVQDCLTITGICVRKIFAPLLRLVYRTQTAYKIKIVHREILRNSRTGRIFALNHRQADDIVIGANAVNQSAYIVFGNPYLAFETLNGLGLWAYGMILLKRDEITSRKAAYEKMKYVIEHGGNIIIFPEGYWNLDDNGQKDERHEADGHKSDYWLIQDINIGILRLAQETGCEIVPTILHYDEVKRKQCFAYRGKPFRISKEADIFAKKDELVGCMTDIYWYLMEKHSSYKRAELEADGMSLAEQWSTLKEGLRSACDIERIGYRLNLAEEKRIGKAKVTHSVVTPEEAFVRKMGIKY